jgi:hypothetical protein
MLDMIFFKQFPKLFLSSSRFDCASKRYVELQGGNTIRLDPSQPQREKSAQASLFNSRRSKNNNYSASPF